jgi:hypothetical protein
MNRNARWSLGVEPSPISSSMLSVGTLGEADAGEPTRPSPTAISRKYLIGHTSPKREDAELLFTDRRRRSNLLLLSKMRLLNNNHN